MPNTLNLFLSSSSSNSFSNLSALTTSINSHDHSSKRTLPSKAERSVPRRCHSIGSSKLLQSSRSNHHSMYLDRQVERDQTAVFQIKWKPHTTTHGSNDDDKDGVGKTKSCGGGGSSSSSDYQEVNMKGSIDLLRSKVDPRDVKLSVTGPNGDTLDVLPLPAGTDWKVTSEIHQAAPNNNGTGTMQAQVVRMSYSNHISKIKIRIGLPLGSVEACCAASAFYKSLQIANFQSGGVSSMPLPPPPKPQEASQQDDSLLLSISMQMLSTREKEQQRGSVASYAPKGRPSLQSIPRPRSSRSSASRRKVEISPKAA